MITTFGPLFIYYDYYVWSTTIAGSHLVLQRFPNFGMLDMRMRPAQGTDVGDRGIR